MKVFSEATLEVYCEALVQELKETVHERSRNCDESKVDNLWLILLGTLLMNMLKSISMMALTMRPLTPAR